jgi:endonuclease/exonuclease/phosphatase (EEP) superfamily protein YafD
VAATVCAAFASSFWLGDLFAHFRVQYAALSLLSVIVFVWLRRPSFIAIALVVLIVNITSGWSQLGWTHRPQIQSASAANAAEKLRVASINVYYRNHDHKRVVQFLREQQPDVVVLVEITPKWRQALDSLDSIYTYRYFSASPIQPVGERVVRGVLLMSRWPIERADLIDFGNWAEPGISATLNVRGQPFHVIGVHPCWPLGPGIAAERNRELTKVAGIARSIKGPLVVLGDFNITPFSPHFETFLRESGLKSAAESNWVPTWPTFLPLAGIQIDHALISPDVRVLSFVRGPRIGSDHWPIVVELMPRLAH